MSPLTPRQAVKIKAGLVLCHDYGHNAQLVSDAARSDIARGLAPKQAYERAFTEFAKGKPELANAITHSFRLIEASDPLTVERYDDALENYRQTGDPASMTSIADTFIKDSVALAVKNGEITAEQAGDPVAIEAAFGFAFAPGAGDRVVAMASSSEAETAPTPVAPPVAQAPTPANTPAPQATSPAQPVNGPQSGYTAPSGWQATSAAGSRNPSFQPIIREKVEPGAGAVIAKAGWSESSTYG